MTVPRGVRGTLACLSPFAPPDTMGATATCLGNGDPVQTRMACSRHGPTGRDPHPSIRPPLRCGLLGMLVSRQSNKTSRPSSSFGEPYGHDIHLQDGHCAVGAASGALHRGCVRSDASLSYVAQSAPTQSYTEEPQRHTEKPYQEDGHCGIGTVSARVPSRLPALRSPAGMTSTQKPRGPVAEPTLPCWSEATGRSRTDQTTVRRCPPRAPSAGAARGRSPGPRHGP